jgi:Zn-dependent protease with chaperone function
VFERTTDGFRAAVIASQVEAHAGAHQRIGRGHLLLGLLTTDTSAKAVLEPFGIDIDRARRTVTPVRPAVPGPPGHIPFGDDARHAIEQALRESLAPGQRAVGTVHLLLALIHDDPALFAALGVDAAAIRAAVLDRAWSEPETDRAATLPELGPPPAPAGRWAAVVRFAGSVLAYLAICAVIAVATGPDGVVAAVLAVVLLAIAGVLTPALARLRRNRLDRRFAGRPAAAPVPAGALAAALAGWGITDLKVYLSPPGARHPNSAAGGGRLGLIRVSPEVMRGVAGRFVLAHEAAHVAHRDSNFLVLSSLGGIYLAGAGAISADPRVLGACLVGAIVFVTGQRWSAELRADRLAAAWIGRHATDIGLAYLADQVKRARRTRRGFIRGLLAWRTHPPLPVRRQWALRHAVIA